MSAIKSAYIIRLAHLKLQSEVNLVVVIVLQLLKVELQFYSTLIIMQMFPFYVFIDTKHRNFVTKLHVQQLYAIQRYQYKMLLVPRNRVHYREESAISVRYEEVFLRGFDNDSFRSQEQCPLYKCVCYKTCTLQRDFTLTGG